MSNYRVIFVPAIEKSAIHTFVAYSDDLKGAHVMLKTIADYTLSLHDLDLMPDYSNFGCIEEYIDGDWSEIDYIKKIVS